jgi:hypothetical protein
MEQIILSYKEAKLNKINDYAGIVKHKKNLDG